MANSNGVYFTDTGNGNLPLVFLHFFGGSSGSWNGLMELLSKTHRCIAIDLAGFGRSEPTTDITTLNDQVELVLRLVKDLQLTQFSLVGHSMGGKIALSVASKMPEGLHSLILVAPSPPTPEPMDDAQRSALEEAYRSRAKIEEIIKKLPAKPFEKTLFESLVADHLAISHSAWSGWLENGSREDISPEMSDISLPVLVVSGSEDSNFSTSFLRKEFGKYFPGAQFAEVADAGHLIPLEQPEKLAKLISDFVGK